MKHEEYACDRCGTVVDAERREGYDRNASLPGDFPLGWYQVLIPSKPPYNRSGYAYDTKLYDLCGLCVESLSEWATKPPAQEAAK